MPFDRDNATKFEPFTARVKHNIMHAIFAEEFEIPVLKQSGIIFENFMLHTNERKAISESWAKYKFRLMFGIVYNPNFHEVMQPLNLIANYYGDRNGMYFAFLIHHAG
eukprot:CAMPEP_0176360940 /NCGR_PEP_ID=MMETSP0126-20121128/17399_1 /TAXON_ID=141414 ORGANISM="Strombidinopsis acuminatum, Strain SPMC142" /NCGR_SAMPLE_ID=MMETSP0126 /ASSEMBLY_ACC=CAM_ASM_000229 /LENGTH=107 /DNA_ID=CAMNT_0017716297 /DNA_START=1715 /DNA_END=2038 /DNA_ORIENTATION=-